MKHLIIIGARGFGREAYRAAQFTKEYLDGEYDIIGFLDDDPNLFDGLKGDYPSILGTVESYVPTEDDVFFCALGDSLYRKHYSSIIENKGGKFISIICAKAIVNPNAYIGEGSYIGDFSMVSDNVHIGRHVLVQCFDDIGHDAFIDDYATVFSYVFIGGYSRIGTCSTMNTKSAIIPHKHIGSNVSVGINSVVIKNVKDNSNVFGTPAINIDKL